MGTFGIDELNDKIYYVLGSSNQTLWCRKLFENDTPVALYSV